MLMHEQSVRVPMIVYDPSEAADGTRGTVSGALVESIDLAPTFVEAIGGTVPYHWLEGRSLLPLLHGETPEDWREFVISEYNYALTPVAAKHGLSDEDARMFMVFDGRRKLIHFEGGIRPMLFDLETDPDELVDLGDSPDHADMRAEMYGYLNAWGRRQSQRVTLSKEQLEGMRGKSYRRGIVLGAYDRSDVPEEALVKYVGKAEADYTKG